MSEVRNTLEKFRNCIINRGNDCFEVTPPLSECNVVVVGEPNPDPTVTGLQIQIYYAGAGPVLTPAAPFDMRDFYVGIAIFYQTMCENQFTNVFSSNFVLEVSDCVRNLILFSNLNELLTLPTQLAESGIDQADNHGLAMQVHQMLFECRSYPRHFDDLLPCDCFEGDCVDPPTYPVGGS